MRRILASSHSAFPGGRDRMAGRRRSAQRSEAELQRKAEAFVRLWEQLQKTEDAGERIALSDEALKLEGELDPWPLSLARDEARGHL